MKNQAWIKKLLNEKAEEGRLRALTERPGPGGIFFRGGKEILNFSSNDYLNFSNQSLIRETISREVLLDGVAACSARLVTGTFKAHDLLEQKLARYFGFESSLMFGAGYLVNLGVVSAICGRDDVIVADKLVHASMIDGAVLSRAQLRRFNHNDVEHCRAVLESVSKTRKPTQKLLLMTESVFSMDGDQAPLFELSKLAREFDAFFLVDEAHALGVFGPNGAGLVKGQNLTSEVDAITSTCSKSFASYGGLLASSNDLKNLCLNVSRPFIYNTALPQVLVNANLVALSLLEEQSELGTELLRRAEFFRGILKGSGLETLESSSHIVPVVLGSAEKVLKVSRLLEEKNIIASPMRPPTVPEGSERIRFSITLAHLEEHLRFVAETLIDILRKEGFL